MPLDIWMQIEILLGSIGVTLSFFFCVLLFNKKHPANIFLAIYLFAFAVRVGKSLFHNFYDISPTFRTFALSLLFCVGPSIWLFIKYQIRPLAQIKQRDWIHYLPFLLLLPACYFIPNNGSPIFGFFYNATIVHMLAYSLFALIWFWKTSISRPLLSSKSVWNWCGAFLISNVLIICWYALISLAIWSYYIGLSLVYSATVVLFSTWALRVPDLFKMTKGKYEDSNLKQSQAVSLMQQLAAIMEEERPYLEPDLTLQKLSQRISTSSKAVSQAINQVEGLNYSQFVARYRLEEAKRLLRSPEHSHLKISAIAYDSGFNSISSFNALFKQHTLMTAQAYRKAGEQ